MLPTRSCIYVVCAIAIHGLLLPPASDAQTRRLWVIESAIVGAPAFPGGGSWDDALPGLLTLNLRGSLPDIQMCLESRRVPDTCAPTCQDADWADDVVGYKCTGSFRPYGLLLEADLYVAVREVDSGPTQQMAYFKIVDPTKCNPCALDTSGGRLSIRFTFAQVETYQGPFRGTVGTIAPPASLPVATPSSERSTATLPPTAAEVESALSDLRDADNCVGEDMFFPMGTVLTRGLVTHGIGSEEANRLYHAASFAMAITDPTAKAMVMEAIRSRVGDETFEGVMTLILGDVRQSAALLAAARDVAEYFTKRLISRGLDRVLPPSRSGSLIPDFERWVLKRMVTRDLANRAVNFMFSGPATISAECVMNQLGKEGFIETIEGR